MTAAFLSAACDRAPRQSLGADESPHVKTTFRVALRAFHAAENFPDVTPVLPVVSKLLPVNHRWSMAAA